MKKYIAVLALLLMGLGFLSPGTAAAQEIGVLVDGLPVTFESSPVLLNGRVLVPFRAIAESLQVEVKWDPISRKVTASQEGRIVELRIGDRTAWKNGRPVFLDQAPIIIEGRTLIPARFFAESLDCRVDWDGHNVLITSPRQKMTVVGFYALGDSRTSSWTNLFAKPYPGFEAGNTDIIGNLALGWYSVDAQGNLLTSSTTGWRRPDGWERVLEAADTLGLQCEMVIHVTEKNNTITRLMASEAAVDSFVSAVLAESQYYHGVNLDFEGLGLGTDYLAERQMFTALVSRLYSALRPAGKTLTLTLHPPNSSYRGYDYSALGGVADRIIVMAYDYGPRPEPDHMVIQAVEMAVREVPKDKLMLGISLPSENAESLAKRIGIAKRYGLDGMALWRLGLVGDQHWQVIREAILPRS